VREVDLLTKVEAVTLLGHLHVRGCDVGVEPIDRPERLWVAPADDARESGRVRADRAAPARAHCAGAVDHEWKRGATRVTARRLGAAGESECAVGGQIAWRQCGMAAPATAYSERLR
jgi:hypothetical protein